jgi:hypothetical protein
MIVYNLLCDNAHRFEGWFASPAAYSLQHGAGHLSCPACGSSRVSRQPSAPHLQTGSREDRREDAVAAKPEMLAQMRRRLVEYIMQHTEDVGERFADEARAIFHNVAPERAIRGKATAQETAELRDEGIEVFTLPGPAVPPEQLH